MKFENMDLDYLPELKEPLFIVGFEGWGNALDIARGMVEYLIEKTQAKAFGRILPDPFYRFDENRPIVEIQEGLLRKVTPPGGQLYAVARSLAGNDLILLKAPEPNLQWIRFAHSLLTLCERLGVKTIIGLGSMYDNVLHTDMVISAVASSQELLEKLKAHKAISVNYKGPSAIHSMILNEALKRGIECFSLWCHCPYYLQGTTHFGLLSHLGAFLSSWGGFRLDTSDLDRTWKELNKQIQGIIDRSPELQGMINDLRKAKLKGSWDMVRKGDKVIHLEDFFKPK
jgi:predicted ATP-grasp superfamily ATP-dependent carboligase